MHVCTARYGRHGQIQTAASNVSVSPSSGSRVYGDAPYTKHTRHRLVPGLSCGGWPVVSRGYRRVDK